MNGGNTSASIGVLPFDAGRLLPEGVTVDDVRELIALLVETGGKCGAINGSLNAKWACRGQPGHAGAHADAWGTWQITAAGTRTRRRLPDTPSPWTPRMVELLETLGGQP